MFGRRTDFDQLDSMFNSVFKEFLSNAQVFDEFARFQTQNTSSENYKQPCSLRDKMLKPDYRDTIGRDAWESEDGIKAETVKENGSSEFFLPVLKDDGMHYSTRYQAIIAVYYMFIYISNQLLILTLSFGTKSDRSSVNYYHSSNGATETKTTSNDREGCYRELITKEYDGKKFVKERRLCPGAPEQITETLVNLNREELPEFLKKWNSDHR